MPTNTVAIDADWITGAGNPPYVLNAPNTVYTLGVDVDVDDDDYTGEVFTLSGDEIVLVLNGKTVRVNGKTTPQNTDSMLYRRTSEYTQRCDVTKEQYMFGGKHGTGVGSVGVVADNIPDSDRPVINGWTRTK